MEIDVVSQWFAEGLWLLEWPAGARLMGFKIKVQPGGFLAILNFISAEGPVVGFYQSPTIQGIYRAISTSAGREAIRLRPDKFALDRFSQST